MKSASISIAAVGDLSFDGVRRDHPSVETLSAVAPILKSADLTIANLESPLISRGSPVHGKCTIRGSTSWAPVIRGTGIRLLSLANNHIMDYGIEGLQNTIEALDKAQLYHVGAGLDKEEACAPRFVDIGDHRIAFLARTSVIVTSPSYADVGQPGVAFLDPQETEDTLQGCKKKADLVVLMMHWGLEEYNYPSPRQRLISRRLIDAGADLILGHHPHVLQGVEHIGNGLVSYSLGNFLFDDLRYTLLDNEGQSQEYFEKLSVENRKGGILNVLLSQGRITSFQFLPTLIQSGAKVKVEESFERSTHFARLSSRLAWPFYSLLWRIYSVRREWELRIKPLFRSNLAWSKFKKIRPKNLGYLLNTVKRCAKISTEKSTNPYE